MKQVVSVAFVLALVACGGSAIGGSSGDGGGGSCTATTSELLGARACVPPAAKAGAELTIEAEGQGCIGCGVTIEPCKVDVVGKSVRVRLEQKTCPLPEGMACPAICGIPEVKCTIPALTAGSYTIELALGEGKANRVRTLVVDEAATATSCELPVGPPREISANDYPRTCTGDADCVLVTDGQPCNPCACANASVSATSRAQYEGDYRSRTAACQTQDIVVCAPCEEKVAKCVGGTCNAVSR